ncbi:MAG: hypothetical protein ABR571_00225 [Jatrophihabitans sp.]|uniref:hypothetical protein n=1 Tax=Jatrophihabitans sp. TaxID=1932789 RepID=UPI00391015A8
MSTELLVPLLIGLVVAFAAAQSVFGVGLLLFGTPTLLLLGLPFNAVLAYLLPCSIAVSALQVADAGGLTLEPIRRQFLLFTCPAVVLATTAAVVFGTVHQMRVAVGATLLLTAMSRVSRLRDSLARSVRRRLRPLLVALGLVHGLSNLGGGLLTVIVASRCADKAEIRRHIAFAYGAMAILQLAVVLTTTRPPVNPGLWAALPVCAAGCYLTVGRRIFRRAGEQPFQVGLTGMIAGYGVLLVATP